MLGAEATGIDYSEEAVSAACELRDELNMRSEFVLSDVYSLPENFLKNLTLFIHLTVY